MSRLMAGVVGIGIVLRLAAFLHRPSLWIDEAMLALNVATRSFRELLSPLDMAQLAPPLFLWTTRAAVILGGVNELALRALPLLASVATLVLLGALVKRVLSPAAAVSAVFLCATSLLLIRYSNEAKPYSSDAVVTLMLILPAWIICEGRAHTKAWWSLALALVIAPLFSFTAILVVPAMFATFALVDIGAVERRRALMLAGLGIVVAAATIAHARDPQVSEYMQHFWQTRFLPRDLAGISSLMSDAVDIVSHAHFSPLDPGALRSVLSDTMEIALFPTIASHTHLYPRHLVYLYVVGSLLLAALGSLSVISRHRARSILIVGPLVAGVGANIAGHYPIAVRLWVFAAPLMVVLLVAGISAMAASLWNARRESLAVTATFLIAFPVVITAVPALWHPLVRREHSRPTVEVIRAIREPSDAVYAYPSSVPAWLVYTSGWQEDEISWLRAYLTADAENAPQRSTAFGVETLGAPSDVRVEYRRKDDADVSEGWGDKEVDRILQRARGCVWTFEANVESPERKALNSALAARGFAAVKYAGDADDLATRYCRATSAVE